MPAPGPTLRFKRVLLTGAAGNLGTQLRARLRPHCERLRLRLTDLDGLGDAAPGEELVPARPEDAAATVALCEGVDAIVHMGGVSTERPWDQILAGNIVGVYHRYEGACRHGVRRIVFASSNHITGFYRQDETIDTLAPKRPDVLYGVSKAFGENLSRMPIDRYGIETVCLRIGSSFPQPKDRRMLATWLSCDDFERLVIASLGTPVAGHTVIFGLSDNRHRWWDSRHAAHIGCWPQDSWEPFRAAVEARQPAIDLRDPVAVALFQGGAFVRIGPLENR